MKYRTIVGALMYDNEDMILLLKTPHNLGVYPDQWGIVGGGIDKGEQAEAALKREVKEETGLDIKKIEPYWFHDEVRSKLYVDGSSEDVYMIYLLFDCQVVDKNQLKLNHEWVKHAWINPEDSAKYDLNAATIKTFTHKGWL